jgi:hypothetical protein
MQIIWPDLTFPPINLWNAPRVMVRESVASQRRVERRRVVNTRGIQAVDAMRRILMSR